MKIGIITHYYNSTNYGGNLQAYALCKFLAMKGYDAEQISYDKRGDKLIAPHGNRSVIRRILSKLKKLPCRIQALKLKDQLAVRSEKILTFNRECIPHSTFCYARDNIFRTNDVYDVFITGSDQVWHPKAVCGAYLLDFVTGVKKISYAASLSVDHLPSEYLSVYQKALSSFSAISVREKDALGLITPISPVPARWVLDPVFLLSKEDWSDFSGNQEGDKPYVFCYFLGQDLKHRKLAGAYAQFYGLELISMPYLNGKYHSCDDGFADVSVFDADPRDFVSYIKNATCIFTDSFHATAFSVIFEKEFFVFGRSTHPSMGSRIHSILSLVNGEDRFLTDPHNLTIEHLMERKPIVYESVSPDLKAMKTTSVEFLLRSIEM